MSRKQSIGSAGLSLLYVSLSGQKHGAPEVKDGETDIGQYC